MSSDIELCGIKVAATSYLFIRPFLLFNSQIRFWMRRVILEENTTQPARWIQKSEWRFFVFGSSSSARVALPLCAIQNLFLFQKWIATGCRAMNIAELFSGLHQFANPPFPATLAKFVSQKCHANSVIVSEPLCRSDELRKPLRRVSGSRAWTSHRLDFAGENTGDGNRLWFWKLRIGKNGSSCFAPDDIVNFYLRAFEIGKPCLVSPQMSPTEWRHGFWNRASWGSLG